MGPGPSVERHLKRAVFGALALWPGSRALPDAGALADVRRVLLVRPNFRLGNLVLATPALDVIARAWPEAQVDVLCGAPYADLFTCDPAVHATIGVERDLHRHPVQLVQLVRRLRTARYDLVIDAARGSSFLGAAFARLSGSRLRVASATSRYRGLFNVHVPNDPASWHKIDLLLGLLRGLGLEVGPVEPRVVLGDDDHRQASDVWRSLGLDHARTVGVALGARGRKRWPLDRVLEAARALRASDRAAVVLFPGPEDRARLAEVADTLPPDVVVAPVLPVRVFGALLARCSAVVTPDSGPMHLAAAVGTPTVTLVRSNKSIFYLPRGPQHRALASLDDVVEAVESLLDAAEAAMPVASPFAAAARRDGSTSPRDRSPDRLPA